MKAILVSTAARGLAGLSARRLAGLTARADRAARWASASRCLSFKPNWDKVSPSSGFQRNLGIASVFCSSHRRYLPLSLLLLPAARMCRHQATSRCRREWSGVRRRRRRRRLLPQPRQGSWYRRQT